MIQFQVDEKRSELLDAVRKLDRATGGRRIQRGEGMNWLERIAHRKITKKATLADERLEGLMRQAMEKFYLCPAAVAFINLIDLVECHHELKFKLVIYYVDGQPRVDLHAKIAGYEDVQFQGETDYRAAIDSLVKGWK